MTSLPGLLGNVMALVQAHPLCQHAEIVETKAFSPDVPFLRWDNKEEFPYWWKAILTIIIPVMEG